MQIKIFIILGKSTVFLLSIIFFIIPNLSVRADERNEEMPIAKVVLNESFSNDGNRFNVSLSVSSDKNICGVYLMLPYDSCRLELVSTEHSDTGYTLTHKIDEKYIKAVADCDPAKATSTLEFSFLYDTVREKMDDISILFSDGEIIIEIWICEDGIPTICNSEIELLRGEDTFGHEASLNAEISIDYIRAYPQKMGRVDIVGRARYDAVFVGCRVFQANMKTGVNERYCVFGCAAKYPKSIRETDEFYAALSFDSDGYFLVNITPVVCVNGIMLEGERLCLVIIDGISRHAIGYNGEGECRIVVSSEEGEQVRIPCAKNPCGRQFRRRVTY